MRKIPRDLASFQDTKRREFVGRRTEGSKRYPGIKAASFAKSADTLNRIKKGLAQMYLHGQGLLIIVDYLPERGA